MTARKSNPSDPTAERTGEASTQEAGGLGRGARGPELPDEREVDDVLNRSEEERYETPRRYEEDDGSPR
jgi:hypothetical protein